MAKIFSSYMDGNSALVMELPNHYVLGGNLYKKQGMLPVPGGVFTLPGPNYGSPRMGFGFGFAAGRGMYEDVFTELGTFYNGPNDHLYDNSLTVINTYSRDLQPRPFVLDTVYPNYVYCLVTGTFNGRAVTAAPAQQAGAVANISTFTKQNELRPMVLVKVDMRSNTIVWEASPYALFPDFVVIKQDETYLYCTGHLRLNLASDKNVASIFTINKTTGAIGMSGSYLTYGNGITLSLNAVWTAAPYMGGNIIGIDGANVWVALYTSSATAGLYTYIGYFTFSNNGTATYVVANVGTSYMGVSSTYGSLCCVRPSNVVDKGTVKYMYTFGPSIVATTNDATFRIYRQPVFVYPLNGTTSPSYTFYNAADTIAFSIPYPTIFKQPALTATHHGIGKLHAFVRDNGDTTKTTFLFAEFILARTALANDDSSNQQYFIKLDVENDATSDTSNKATLVQTFYDAHYGLVWIDDLTFMTVGLTTVRVYKVNLAAEQIQLVNEYRVSTSGMEIAYAAIDTSKNIWYVERSMPSKAIHNIYFETAYVVSQVEIVFQLLEANYTGTNISTNIEVATKNNQGEYLVSEVQLELEGPAQFTSNSTNKLTVTTLNTGVLVVPITVTGPGYVNCVGKVVD